jgi:hypothetical protein
VFLLAAGWLIPIVPPVAAQTTAVPTSPTPGAGASAASAPLPNRLNEVLPSWLRVRGEFRERVESIENIAYVDARDDLFWLTRFRFNASVTPSKQLSFFVQAQDARAARKDGTVTAPFRGPIDFRMAYADVGAVSGPVSARLGRQELVFGEQRLVGHANWANTARSFDGVRATFRRKTLQLDVFAASLVRIMQDDWDQSGNGNRFIGAYASTTALVPKSTIEPYVFWRRDRDVRMETGGLGVLHQSTAGVRWVGQLPSRLEYGIETAVQTGSLGSDSVGAWAGHYQVRTPAYGPSLRLVGEYNYASGDADPTDGDRGTFDQLYPTPHDKYGLADQVGWRNIHHVRTGVEIGAIKATPITASYHTWWLASATDGLYLATGTLLARIPSGAPDRHVGQEIDVQVSRALTPYLQVSGGYAYIRPGAFLKTATPGASYSSPFLMLTYVFLAEK